MNIKAFYKEPSNIKSREIDAIVKAEIPIERCVGEPGTVLILLDAEDTFDVIIQDSDGNRDIIHSFIKDAEE